MGFSFYQSLCLPCSTHLKFQLFLKLMIISNLPCFVNQYQQDELYSGCRVGDLPLSPFELHFWTYANVREHTLTLRCSIKTFCRSSPETQYLRDQPHQANFQKLSQLVQTHSIFIKNLFSLFLYKQQVVHRVLQPSWPTWHPL